MFSKTAGRKRLTYDTDIKDIYIFDKLRLTPLDSIGSTAQQGLDLRTPIREFAISRDSWQFPAYKQNLKLE